MHDIIEINGGTEKIVFTNTRRKCNRRLIELRASQKFGSTYNMQRSDASIPYEKKANKSHQGNEGNYPALVKD